MKHPSVTAIVLAAGKGTRMKSDRAKVLQEVFFAPMIHHVMDALAALPLNRTLVVTGHCRFSVEAALASYNPTFVHQEKQLGTGHAVLTCEQEMGDGGGTVLILCGDTPLIRAETLASMLREHQESGSLLTVMTTRVEDPSHYGRIIRDQDGALARIVEEKDADAEQKEIGEINAGIYCVDSHLLFHCLRQVRADNRQGELYLTDIVALSVRQGVAPRPFVCRDSNEVLGVNSRREQARAHFLLQQRYLHALMDSGVTILHPESVVIGRNVTIGRDSLIHPYVVLQGRTTIGAGVTVESFATVIDSAIGDGVQVAAYSCLRDRRILAGQEPA